MDHQKTNVGSGKEGHRSRLDDRRQKTTEKAEEGPSLAPITDWTVAETIHTRGPEEETPIPSHDTVGRDHPH